MLGVEMDRLYSTSDYIYRASDPTRAVGADLEKIGFIVGESRTNAVVATDFTITNFHFKNWPFVVNDTVSIILVFIILVNRKRKLTN